MDYFIWEKLSQQHRTGKRTTFYENSDAYWMATSSQQTDESFQFKHTLMEQSNVFFFFVSFFRYLRCCKLKMEMLNKYNDELFKTCSLNSMEKSWKMVKKSTGWYFHYDAKLQKKKMNTKSKYEKTENNFGMK